MSITSNDFFLPHGRQVRDGVREKGNGEAFKFTAAAGLQMLTCECENTAREDAQNTPAATIKESSPTCTSRHSHI